MGKIKIVKASAGSGKTFMLAYEYIRIVVQNPERYRNILAVTFTNKATEEMKSRILEELYALSLGDGQTYRDMLSGDLALSSEQITQKAKKALNLILHDYSNFSVFTIDGFFQKIVRSFIKELHLESDYEIDFNQDYLLGVAMDLLIREAQEDSVLQEWIDGFIDDNIEQSKQFDLKKNMKILSSKIFDDEFDKSYFIDNRDVLIAFFGELKKWCKNFEGQLVGLANKFLKIVSDNNLSDSDFLYGKNGFISYVKKVSNRVFEDYGKRVSDAVNNHKKMCKSVDAQNVAQILQPVLLDICSCWDGDKYAYNSVSALLKTHRTFVMLGELSTRLDSVCSQHNKMLLSNTNYLINKLIKDNDTPFIYEKIGSKYDVIMIDEFQDTSRKQWENFVPLLNNSLSEGGENDDVVTIVGDVKQSIYRWRGGDWRILGRDVVDMYDENQCHQKTLDTNYRSKKIVVDFNNKIISETMTLLNNRLNEHLADSLNKQMIDTQFAYNHHDILSKAYSDVTQHVPQHRGDDGYAEVCFYDAESDKEQNLKRSVELVIDLQARGYKASDITILVRSNKQARVITDFILKYKEANDLSESQACLDIISNEGLLLEKADVVKFIVSVYSLAIEDDSVVRAFFNKYLGRELNEKLTSRDGEFISKLAYSSMYESFERVVDFYKLANTKENVAYIQALHDAVLIFASKNSATCYDFMEWWSSEGVKKTISLPEGQNAINIITAHKSKGLQYKAVILPFTNWNTQPMAGSNFWAKSSDRRYQLPESDGNTALISYNKALNNSYFSAEYLKELILSSIESFNIFYVALTRAENELYVISPKSKGEKDNMGNFINSAVQNIVSRDADMFKNEKVTDVEVYSYGEKMTLVDRDPVEAKNESIKAETYNFADYHERLKLHLESDKYYKMIEDNREQDFNKEESDSLFAEATYELEEQSKSNDTRLNPRGRGIMLHKVFEHINTLEDIPNRVKDMCSNGYLTSDEADALNEIISKAILNPLIKSWYESGWTVRNESSIILPRGYNGNKQITLRPDRVILRDNEAVVIDYKFGDKNSSHVKQIKVYKELLQKMGYSDVRGYIWYISEQNVVEVK